MNSLLARSVAAALLTAGALAAQANPADIQVTRSLGALSSDAVIGDSLAGGKTFDEFFQFSLPADSALGWTITASVANFTGLSALSSSLYAGSLASLSHSVGDPVALASGLSYTDDFTPSSPTFWTYDPGTVDLADLAGGQYTLVISGKALAGGGAFGGVLGVTPAAPVPEPDTYAMFIAGLGILGAIARRGRPINLVSTPRRGSDMEASL